MLFDLSADQRYELEHDGPETSWAVYQDGQFWYFIEDGLCSLIQATYIYVPIKANALKTHMENQGAPGGRTPGGPAFIYDDAEALADICQRLADPDIQAAVYFSETGEYAPIWVTHDWVDSDSWAQADWFRIHKRHPETGRIMGGSTL